MTADQTGATLRRNIERLRRLTAQTVVADVPPPIWPQSYSDRRGARPPAPGAERSMPKRPAPNGTVADRNGIHEVARDATALGTVSTLEPPTPVEEAAAPETGADSFAASNGTTTNGSATNGAVTAEIAAPPMPLAPPSQPLLLPAPAWPRPRVAATTSPPRNGLTPLPRDEQTGQPIAFRSTSSVAPLNGAAATANGAREGVPAAGSGLSPEAAPVSGNGSANGTEAALSRTASRPTGDARVSGRCSARRTDGEPCGASPVPGYDTCIGHGAWNRKSPEAKRRRPSRGRDSEQLTPARLLETLNRLEWALREVLDGDLDPQRARAVAAVGDALGRVVEVGLVERRLADLEARMDGLPD